MRQRLLVKRCASTLLVMLFSSFFFPHLLSAQDQLKVEFDFTSISSATEISGVQADFPYWVLSLITIRDQNNHYVHGLADTSRWLAPTDTNQVGLLVDDVWNTILEYHEEDNAIPPDPNVKSLNPSYMVREALDIEGYTTSMAMVMDYSSSMEDQVYVAEDASRSFIRRVNRRDRLALIKFTGKIEMMQEFTSDTTLLMEALESPTSDRHVTALYDAVYLALEACADEPGRPAVIAYTDGADNASGHSLNGVIAYARELDIPVFLIGLGLNPNNASLSRLAEETGGLYVVTPSAEGLEEIYIDIYSRIRGYYVLATNSPDPDPNGTWRNIDLTVEYNDAEGQALGRYFVSYIAPDIEVSATIQNGDVEGQVIPAAAGGDTLTYSILLVNQAEGPAFNVKVVDDVADSLDVLEAGLFNTFLSNDSLVWEIPRMEIGDSLILNYVARIRPVMPMDSIPLINHIQVHCPDDADTTNNRTTTTVWGRGLADLIPRMVKPNITISPGYPFTLSAYIQNNGTADIVHPFTVSFSLPDGTVISSDTVNTLIIGDSVLVEVVWPDPERGEYNIEVFADNTLKIPELNEENNKHLQGVKVGVENFQVQISDVTYSESIQNITGYFHESILSRIQIIDQNDNPVKSLATFEQWVGPDDMTDINVAAKNVWTKFLEYHRHEVDVPDDNVVRDDMLVTEQRGQSYSLGLVIDFAQDYSWIQQPLNNFVASWTRSEAGAVTSAETSLDLQTLTQDIGLIRQSIDQDYEATARLTFDAINTSLQQIRQTSYRHGVLAILGGEDTGSEISLNVLSEKALEAKIPIYIVQTGNSISNDLQFLAEQTGGFYWLAGDVDELSETLISVERILQNFYVTAHTSSDTLQNGIWRTIDAEVTVFGWTDSDSGFYQAPAGIADVGVKKSSRTNYFTVQEGDTLYSASPGDTVYYSFQVTNTGHQVLSNITVSDVLPSAMSFLTATPNPLEISGDTLKWQIATLPVFTTQNYSYQCIVDTIRSATSFYMINQLTADCLQDTSKKNNVDQDSVLFIPLGPANLDIKKHALGDSLVVSGQDTIWYTNPGSLVDYALLITNIGALNARDVIVEDILADYLTLNHAIPTPDEISGDTLRWNIDQISGHHSKVSIFYSCLVDSQVPPWKIPVVNYALVTSPDDTLPQNNAASDTIWVTGLYPPDPEIQVAPSLVEPGDSVDVQVMTPVEVKDWDLIVIFEDGSQQTTYGDPFIQSTPLVPNVWTPVIPPFGNTYFTIPGGKEVVAVVFETTDVWDVVRSDTAWFTIGVTDVAIEKYAQTDSLEIVKNDTIWYVDPRDTVSFTLSVKNIGWHTAKDIQVVDALPEGLTYFSSSKTPVSITNTNITWMVDSIEVGKFKEIQYQCTVDTIPISRQKYLVNGVTISCPNDTIPGNDADQDTLIYDPLDPADVIMYKSGIGDSLSIVNGDSVWFVHPGNEVTYTLTVKNIGEISCQNIEVRDVLPDFLTFKTGTPAPIQKGDTLYWKINKLGERGGLEKLTYTCQVSGNMPSYHVPLVNKVWSVCPEDSVPGNNTTSDTVWVIGKRPPRPSITVNPTLIEPTDTVNVQVMSPVAVTAWDLEVHFVNQTISTIYGDNFISNNTLLPNQWLSVRPALDDTRMRSDESPENVRVVLITTDYWGLVQSDTAYFQIQSQDAFYLDRNVFKPYEGDLGLRFQLSANRVAKITIYDISGAKMITPVDDYFYAGWHTYTWDGVDEWGNRAGSGIYVAILESGSYKKVRKFILVR